MSTRWETATSIFAIQGADQPGHLEKLKKAVKKMPGVLEVEVNHLMGTAKVRYDPNILSLARIKAEIGSAGTT